MTHHHEQQQLSEAIILAGGLGTRLRSAVPDLPKCMAPVNGKPFLYYVLAYLEQQGISRFVFSLGYLHEKIEEFLSSRLPAATYQTVVETEPLGTGGAIQLACTAATQQNVVVVNGDTLFTAELPALGAFHAANAADCTLALKPMTDFDRYGVVETDGHNRIRLFKEKQYYPEGLINGGLYALNVPSFLAAGLPAEFSFEKDYLEQRVTGGQLFAQVHNAYFIDIGIPADYERAQEELKYLFT